MQAHALSPLKVEGLLLLETAPVKVLEVVEGVTSSLVVWVVKVLSVVESTDTHTDRHTHTHRHTHTERER